MRKTKWVNIYYIIGFSPLLLAIDAYFPTRLSPSRDTQQYFVERALNSLLNRLSRAWGSGAVT